MSAEGFEKTRIQNPDEAHEEANMLSAQVEESLGGPTAEDYDNALVMLEELQKEAENESPLVNKVMSPMKSALAGSIAAGSSAGEILGLALVNVGNKVLPISEAWKKRDRQDLLNAVEAMGDSYEMHRANLASARERLEQWKAEAEDYAKRQTEQE